MYNMILANIRQALLHVQTRKKRQLVVWLEALVQRQVEVFRLQASQYIEYTPTSIQ